ncbi:MAG: type III-B CRISPR module RAMP protein Cmr6 [Myxococcales bacterium]|nr:type III-B CRISPR module RAMP protein Cmr6 [Myxococcales bacterium]
MAKATLRDPDDESPPCRKQLGRLQVAPSSHVGLWLQSYQSSTHSGENNGKHQAATLETAGSRIPAGYQAAFARREATLRGHDGGTPSGVTRVYEATVEGRMVVGIGDASVHETSVSLLHTWGVPFIPGSALKGVAAVAAGAYGDAWRAPSEPGADAGESHQQLFGDVGFSGLVTFHDAWWIPPADGKGRVPLDLDVMTVHHADYYSGKKDAGPQDWDEPNPVGFISARGTYLFALSGPADWVDLAARFLSEALQHHGVGAKTAAGYGRMTTLEPRLSEADRRAEAAREQADRARQAANERLARVSNPDVSPDERTQRVDVLARLQAEDPEGPARVREVARQLVAQDVSWWRKWLEKDRPDSSRELVESVLPAEEDIAAAEDNGVRAQAKLASGKVKKERDRKVIVRWADGTESLYNASRCTVQEGVQLSKTELRDVRVVESGKRITLCAVE